MADPYRQLPHGASVTAISRTAYNKLMEMLRWWLGHKQDVGVGDFLSGWRSTTEILVRNDSGASVPAFGILGLDVPVILPSSANSKMNALSCQARPAMAGVEPDPADHRGKWVALLEPASDSTADPLHCFARAVLLGYAVVRVYVNVATDLCVDVIAPETVGSETVYLGTGGTGSDILWLEAVGAGYIGWAVVRIGSTNSGPLKGVLDDILTQYGTATVSIHDSAGDTGRDVEAKDWMLPATAEMPVGTHVIVAPCLDEWIVINSACPPAA